VAQAPEVRPAHPSAKFKLHGISYRSSRPEDSMALVWEPDVAIAGSKKARNWAIS
jgi:hypothetical protein